MEPEGDPKDGEKSTMRRDFLTGMGGGLIAIATGSADSAESQSAKAPFRYLSEDECRTLEALGDTLLPGAAEAGLARYVDDQLGRETPLLFLRYTDYVGSSVDFYKQGLQSLDREAQTRYSQRFIALEGKKKSALVRDLSQKSPPGWIGPPAPLFYFVTRNDAVDVYYGTQQGFEKLGMPYMAMIAPPKTW